MNDDAHEQSPGGGTRRPHLAPGPSAGRGVRRRSTPRTLVGVGTALLLAGALTLIPSSTASAATKQYGCTFNVPKVSRDGSKAKATVSVTCDTMGAATASFSKRQLVVDVVGDDGVRTHVVDWRVVSLPTPERRGSVTRTLTGLKCNEDVVGSDEIFLTMRVEAYQRGALGGWKKGTPIKGAVVKGLTCA